MHFSPQGGSPSWSTKFRSCSRWEDRDADEVVVVVVDSWLGDVGGKGFKYAEMRCKRKN